MASAAPRAHVYSIHNTIKEKFLAAVQARVEKLHVGHPLDPSTEVGPLVHQDHFNKVLSYFTIAAQDGATVAAGGYRRKDLGDGNYLAPTLFTHANNSMRIAREEIFGPVLTAIGFDTEAEAIAIANDTDYGAFGLYLDARYRPRYADGSESTSGYALG